MSGKLDFEIWGGEMTGDLKELFIGDEDWPLAAASLAALIDLGMSDESIAGYFSVDAERVTVLRKNYGLEATTR